MRVPEKSSEGKIAQLTILRLREGKLAEDTDHLAVERPLVIELNDRRVALLMRSPGEDLLLGIGYLFTEGFISSFKDVASAALCDDGSISSRDVLKVYLRDGAIPVGVSKNKDLFFSLIGCGESSEVSGLTPVNSQAKFKLKDIMEYFSAVRQRQEVHELTGGTHMCAFFAPNGDLVCSFEDVGRHNAFDKCVGFCLFNHLDTSQMAAFVSGRISSDICVKAVRAHMPLVASLLMPTSLAVEVAQRYGCALIGFARKGRANIYSHRERVQWQ